MTTKRRKWFGKQFNLSNKKKRYETLFGTRMINDGIIEHMVGLDFCEFAKTLITNYVIHYV